MFPQVQPIFTPDTTNNSNDSIYSDIAEEKPAGGETEKFMGMVMRINSAGLTVYVPLERCYNLFVPTKCIGNLEVRLGDWISTMAQKRRPREDDLGHQPRFSHMAIGSISLVKIADIIPSWKQRFSGGIFEFRMLVEISPNFEFPIYEKNYLVPATVHLKMLIPCDRLDAIWRVGTTTSRFFELWVTLANYVPISLWEGVSLHLLDSNTINEILPDGTVVNLGAAKLLQQPNGNGYEYGQLSYDYESDENSSTSTAPSDHQHLSPSQDHLISSAEFVPTVAEQDVERRASDNRTRSARDDVLRAIQTLLSNSAIKTAITSSHLNM